MRMRNLVGIAVVLMVFAAGIGFGIYSAENAEPVVAAPLVIDFCSLATNQDYLVGARIQTTAEMLLSLEGGVLESDSCPTSMLVFRPPNNDTCWQKISSDYYRNDGAGTDFLVQVEGSVRGRRGLARWIHEGNKPIKDAAHRPPMVTIDVDRIMSCIKK
jgi:hypothetical protein